MISETSGSAPSQNTPFSQLDSSSDLIEEPPDERGNYEVVDILPRKKNPTTPTSSSSVFSSSYPAPQYRPPSPPGGKVDAMSDEDLEDLHDYEKVTPGGCIPGRECMPDHSKEFAPLPLKFPSDYRRYPRQTSAPAGSRQTGFPPQPVSPPPSPPREGNFGVLTYPTRSKSRSVSPPLAVESEPIFEDRKTIQRKVLQGMATPPQAPPISTIPSLAGGHGPRPPDQPYFDHLFPTQTPPNKPLPPDPPVDEDVYWDHLSNQSSKLAIDSEYSLVKEWTDHTDGRGGGGGGASTSPNNNMTYDIIRRAPSPYQSKKDASVS